MGLHCLCETGSAVVRAGGLNEYIWQAWAYLESKQNNVGQARKVCAGFLAYCGGIIPTLLFALSSCFHNQLMSSALAHSSDCHRLH